jgi:hypothetical protein
MNRRRITILGAAIFVMGVATGSSAALAQQTTFQTYRCADGST